MPFSLVQHPGMSCIFHSWKKHVNFNVFSGKAWNILEPKFPPKTDCFATLRLHELEALTWSQLTYLWRHRRFLQCSFQSESCRLGENFRSWAAVYWCLGSCLWRRIILVDLSLSYIVMLIARCPLLWNLGVTFEPTFNTCSTQNPSECIFMVSHGMIDT